MRHQKRTAKLGRTGEHRNAMLANLVCSLIKHKRVTTSLAKAKAARSVAEKMVTLGKRGTLATRRLAVAQEYLVALLDRVKERGLFCHQVAPHRPPLRPLAGKHECQLVFATRRAYDFIAIATALGKANVKIIAGLPGLTTGYGGTHQGIEDLALMRMVPNLVVIDPCDATELTQAVPIIAAHEGPVYMRLLRGKVPIVLDPADYRLELGKAKLLKDGGDSELKKLRRPPIVLDATLEAVTQVLEQAEK